MLCAICGDPIKIYEFDLLTAFNTVNPLTFRTANMHSACYSDALDEAAGIESNHPQQYKNRLDEYLTTKV